MPPIKRVSQQNVGMYLLWLAFLLLGVSYVVTTIVSFNKFDSIAESMLLKRVADVEEKNTLLMNVLNSLNMTVSGIDVNMSLVPLVMDVEGLKMTNATVRQVNTGVGLTGGPITQEGTISMETLDPDPSGTYGDASQIPQIVVDSHGRVVAATNVSVSPLTYVEATLNGDVDLTSEPDLQYLSLPTSLSITLDPGTWLMGMSINLEIVSTSRAFCIMRLFGSIEGQVRGSVIYIDNTVNGRHRETEGLTFRHVVTTAQSYEFQIFKASPYSSYRINNSNGISAEIWAWKMI